MHGSSSAATLLTLGVVATSRKPDERRLPIHPDHLERIDADVRRRIVLETGYGERFGVDDDALRELVGGVAPRAEVMDRSDVVLLAKPQVEDLAALPPGTVLWGWPHCVQDVAVTQAAIDRRLSLIAFEAMHHWAGDRGFGLHVFHKNNELAGYCSVLHALQLTGMTGDYGRPLRAVVIGFGATARGAVTALNALGIHDVHVLTHRGVAAVAAPIHSVRIAQIDADADSPDLRQVITERGRVPLAPYLAESDVVVNCTLQDTDAPVTYLRTADLVAFRPGSVIVDVSCDPGMGFSWAHATSFADPLVTVGDGVAYYGVDHSPSHLWRSATWEVSEALLPFIRTVLEGPPAWEADETIRRAIEIRDGQVLNPAILSFQGRAASHPHARAQDPTGTTGEAHAPGPVRTGA